VPQVELQGHLLVCGYTRSLYHLIGTALHHVSSRSNRVLISFAFLRRHRSFAWQERRIADRVAVAEWHRPD